MSDLGQQLRKITEKTGDDLNEVLTVSAFKLTKAITLKSPVDTGRFRGNWIATSSRPSKRIHGNVRSPETVHNEALEKISNAVLAGTTWYLVNNLPYARVLEYGLYPKVVKRGTWVKSNKGTKGHYEIRSKNGFSKQAQAGVVRISKKKFLKDLKKEILKKQTKKGK